MLNARALGDLLTKNRDERLCKRWFLMTPNGTLLSYSQPTDIKDLRKQAAMTATTWQEHDGPRSTSPEGDHQLYHNRNGGENGEAEADSAAASLQTLTIETESSNFIMRRLQPQLLLVLEGGVPRRRSSFESHVTAEGPEDEPYPGTTATTTAAAAATTTTTQNGAAQGSAPSTANQSYASSLAESTTSTAARNVLGAQRKRLDAMAAAIAEHFDRTGFHMPEDEGIKLF